MSDYQRSSDTMIEKLLDSQEKQTAVLAALDERTRGMDSNIKRINGNIAEVWVALHKVEERASTLEQWRSGIVAVYSTAWAVFLAWLKWDSK